MVFPIMSTVKCDHVLVAARVEFEFNQHLPEREGRCRQPTLLLAFKKTKTKYCEAEYSLSSSTRFLDRSALNLILKLME